VPAGPTVSPLRLTVLFPFLRLTGGLKMLADYANGLARRGHAVTGVVPVRLKCLPLHLNRLEWLWRRPRMLARHRWFDPLFDLRVVPCLCGRWMPEADAVVASSWQTAVYAGQYPDRCGRRAYYIQDVETHERPEAAGATYRLPLAHLVTSDWIARELTRQFGERPRHVVPYGIDAAFFGGRPRPALPARLFGMLHSRDPRKGFADGFEAFQRVRARHPELRLLLFGTHVEREAFPGFVEVRAGVTPAATPALYREADAWICASRSEGWGLPPLEAMASGCAVVTTRVGGTPYFAEHERTALVCEPGDGAALEAAIERLASDGELVARLSAAGLARVGELPWEASVERLEAALLEVASGG
jgi:glycosyltransferase involved in cell wall biosynthesis